MIIDYKLQIREELLSRRDKRDALQLLYEWVKTDVVNLKQFILLFKFIEQEMFNEDDTIIVEGMFEGTPQQFSNCFFSNVTPSMVKSWAEANGYNVKIKVGLRDITT